MTAPPASPPGWGPPMGPPPDGPASTGLPPAHLAPHRGPLVLAMALGSLMVLLLGCAACAPLGLASLGLSIPAWVIGKRDLAAIEAGEMKADGKDLTTAGMVAAGISVALTALLTLVSVGLMVLYGGLIGAAIASG